ncbi:DUF4179 domain-containing protein [Paenibacillus gorillae]|uniref:DUF4179 domain-containing protein n=1 Tax=Paenibacillus gorillae TaxID=1243662 RepID=UPI0004B40CD3|nr:DUF4179 domain-containing protein [Paenibacillus gorillae]
MTTIEEKLEEHKLSLAMAQTPAELENRLRKALQNAPVRKRKRNRALTWIATAAAALILIAGAYQYPAFAYYGGKLFNKVELHTLSFAELSEQGYGQTVNTSKTLKDGTVITISGVIADDNALSMYYSIDRPEGSSIYDANGSHRYDVWKVEGFLTDSNATEGGGNPSKNDTRFEGVQKFKPVSPFAKTLTVEFSEWLDNGKRAVYPISFKFDANKAMKSLISQDIGKSIAVDGGAVYYDSIKASPTSTIVKGHYEIEKEIGGFPRFEGKSKLYVNGNEVMAYSNRANLDSQYKYNFAMEFDVLPTDKIESIELELVNFPSYQKVEKPISLASPSDLSLKIGSEKLWIRSVTKTAQGYDIVIARKQFTFLVKDGLSVQAGGQVVPVSSISKERPWDLKNGNILWEQTYSFATKDKPEFLLVDGFDYIKTYKQKISVPLSDKK